ncbi:MAG TPA: hypothetical protein VMX14_13330 [Anaerolineae bacterium]|nr:hypothetical protein [Anaerolineae bacterium]
MTAIYTCIPQDVQTPEQAAQYREAKRQAEIQSLRTRQTYQPAYILIPDLTMENLPGTTWRNLWTADLHTVATIGPDRFGKIGPDPTSYATFSIGHWTADRFQIRDWVRVDRLPTDIQIAWAVEHVRHCKTALHATHEQNEHTGKKTRGTFTRFREEDVQLALNQLHKLIEEHQLPPINPVTIALPGEQLQLFA